MADGSSGVPSKAHLGEQTVRPQDAAAADPASYARRSAGPSTVAINVNLNH